MSVILKKIAFLFFVISSVTSDISNDVEEHLNDVDSDPDMEKYLREALENFRDQMKIGIDAIHMPRLDPLELRNLDINVNENLATLSLRLKQMTIEELSQFQAESIVANLETFFLSLKCKFPVIRATGRYAMNGKLLKIFPLNGNGSFSINVTNADISGVGKLAPMDGTLQMDKLDLDLTWNKLDASLENFLGGGRFSQVLQQIVPNVGKNVFNTYKPEILRNLNTLLIRELNKVFRKPEVKKIVESLIP